MAAGYDLMVIGAGAAGGTAATLAARAGARVALAERGRLGGTCLNYGCDPARTLADIASAVADARDLQRFGLRLEPARPSWPDIVARVAEVIDELRGGSPRDAMENVLEKGIDLYRGEARFGGPHEVSIDEQTIRAGQVLIATGSRNIVPAVPGLKEVGFITNEEAVRLPDLPRRLAIIGAGATGIEFGQVFTRCGSEVTIIDRLARILPAEEGELVERLCELLTLEGLQLELGARIEAAESAAGGKRLHLARDGRRWELEVDEILVAAGRQPATASLCLEAAGVASERGSITVNERMQTSVPHIWAAGDAVGGGFTHVAGEQAKVVVANAIEHRPASFDHRTIPYSLFSDPGIARVGLTERQAREAGLSYQVGRMDFRRLVRAIIQGRTAGMVKLIVGEQRRLLGAHILAPQAGNLIAPAVVALRCSLTVDALYEAVQPYPTLVESIRWAANPANLSTGEDG